MILYFSGTGNSRYAAETLAHLTDDIAVNMTSLWPADGPTAMHIGNNETLGVVFPVYAWAAPMIVSETLARIAVEPGAYIYAVCTCGDDAGCAIEKLQRQIPLCAAWSLQMPNNYLPMYDVDDPALMKRKLTEAKPRLAAIAEQIRGKRHVFDVRKSAGALFKTWVIHPFLNGSPCLQSRSMQRTAAHIAACVRKTAPHMPFKWRTASRVGKRRAVYSVRAA